MPKLPPEELHGTLGKDPKTGTDFAFYDWLDGTDQEKTISGVLDWLIEDLREEQDEGAVRSLLEEWKKDLPVEEFTQRIAFLEKLMPPNHVFHSIKQSFIQNT